MSRIVRYSFLSFAVAAAAAIAAADEWRLNEIIWRSARGAARPMPAPVHAAFFAPHGE